MKKLSLPTLLVGVALAIATPAAATTYLYTSNELGNSSFDDYLTASVDLNCAGPCAEGTYHYSSDITSYSLSAYAGPNPVNFLVFSFISGTPGVDGNFDSTPYDNYLTLDSAGLVTSWFLRLKEHSSLWGLTTSGNDPYFGSPPGR
jgi:hypothetical protein